MNTNPDPNDPLETPIDVEDLRPHTYDGIQEYDKRLPNWWLGTFYGAIAFSVGYWLIVHTMGLTGAANPGIAVRNELKEAKEAALKNSPELSDAKLWVMSQDAVTTAAGKQIFETTCAACHRSDLMGQIGPNLRDHDWVHGGKPMDLVKTINEGVLAKGMPTWAPILGASKISQVAAYILSYHKDGEPIEIKPWVPVGVPPAPPAAN